MRRMRKVSSVKVTVRPYVKKGVHSVRRNMTCCTCGCGGNGCR